MLEKRMLRRIFELKKEEMTGDWRNSSIMRNFINLAPPPPNIV
jgi:hypothetical protein